MDTLKMILHKDLNQELQKEILSYLVFLRRKQTKIVKNRGYCDEKKGKSLYKKGKSNSPTVSTSVLMCAFAINAIEKRKVITCNIPAAFLQTSWLKEEYLNCIHFDGEMVGMICKIDKK